MLFCYLMKGKFKVLGNIKLLSANHFNLDLVKILSSDLGLNLYERFHGGIRLQAINEEGKMYSKIRSHGSAGVRYLHIQSCKSA